MLEDTLIFGGNGFMGRKFREKLPRATYTTTDITDRAKVKNILDLIKPKYIINCAGKTGRPNVDWCEDHEIETADSNIRGPITLAKECIDRKIHMIQLGSGCIYEGDNSGKGFSETDAPNFFGSIYSLTKIECEEGLKELEGPILQLRLRMPFDKVPSQRNFITKLVGYKKIINENNSISVIDDFLDATTKLMEKKTHRNLQYD